jgi:hypothetical protein
MSNETNAISSTPLRPGFDFLGIIRNSPPLHFYLLQFIAFSYLLFRFLSRDFSVYGLLPEDAFNYPRTFGMELWPIPLLHLTTFQFIYDIIPRPNQPVILTMQFCVIGASGTGLLGIRPKLCAIVAFAFAMHLTGMVQASNAEIEGGTLALCAILVLALSPSTAFYRWGHNCRLSQRNTAFHWPVFLFLMIVGCFYSLAGLNKVIDVGPHWPFVAHLEHLATYSIETSLFTINRYSNAEVAAWFTSPWTSYIGGPVTFVAELGFILILFRPRWRLSLVATMCIFHGLVYYLAGINFVGSGFLLLLCFDWNMLVRRGTVLVNSTNGPCSDAIGRIERMDRWGLMTFEESPEIDCDLIFRDENGMTYSDVAAIEQIAARCPRLWAMSLLSRVPLVHLLVHMRFKRQFAIGAGRKQYESVDDDNTADSWRLAG